MALPSFSWVNETSRRMRGGVPSTPWRGHGPRPTALQPFKAFTVAEVPCMPSRSPALRGEGWTSEGLPTQKSE